ncbi:MAG: hypothetical protein HY22_12565 [[Candidatus Thermochlorobacteriaceae] bacterium GBChlB]|jgi:BCD family chlorophyll transporter-like MFS transporter|nr:MAG: hypothetical protein HY22_12565 [[Candidatus Thermochlorobacteriaceae] bacterium GBChlB]
MSLKKWRVDTDAQRRFERASAEQARESQAISIPAPYSSETASTAPAEAQLQKLSREIPLPRVLQICLLQFSTAICFVLTSSTLNRVMIVEFGIDAWLVGVLIGLHNLLSVIRPAVGFYSDTHLWFGYRRTPSLIVGNLILVSGMVMSIYGAILMKDHSMLGVPLVVLAFVLYGIGINITGTMFYALLADSAGEKHKSKAVTTGWFVLILGTIVISGIVGAYLKEFSNERLVSLFWFGALGSMFFTWLALIGTEKRFARADEIVVSKKSEMDFRTALQKLVANKPVFEFFLFMFITVIAIQGQDVILEPYGAHLFGMSVSETTALTRIWGTGTMLGILTLGLFFVNRLGKKKTTYIGCLASALGFSVIILSPSVSVDTFKVGVFLLGVGNGALTVGTLTMMMDMTTEKNAGLFMGLWGMAQALANFLANTVCGGIRDVSLWLTGNQFVGYATAFTLEVFALVVAVAVLRGIDMTEFKRKTSYSLADVAEA